MMRASVTREKCYRIMSVVPSLTAILGAFLSKGDM